MSIISYSDIDKGYYKDTQTADFKKNINEDAVKNSLRNILMTRKFERRMNPEFGASLEQLLFEPMDEITSKKLGKIINDEIKFWEPRITIQNIFVIMDEEKLQYEVNIEFIINDLSSINTSSISFVLQQG